MIANLLFTIYSMFLFCVIIYAHANSIMKYKKHKWGIESLDIFMVILNILFFIIGIKILVELCF